MYETGLKACKILQSALKGEIQPTVQFRKIPMIPSGNMHVPAGPLGPFFQLGAEENR